MNVDLTQTFLLCGCGGDIACRYCERRRRLNQERYAGNREYVLRRDEYQCQLCGSLDHLVVHHRRPGQNRPQFLITLCRACHVRVHFTIRPGFAFQIHQLQRALWREQHRRQAEQRLLPIGEAAQAQQASFFDDPASG